MMRMGIRMSSLGEGSVGGQMCGLCKSVTGRKEQVNGKRSKNGLDQV